MNRRIAYCREMRFIGVDLGWYGKPTGLAALEFAGECLRITALDRVTGGPAILDWIGHVVGAGPAMIAIDAPTVIPNPQGSRPAERQVTSAYGRYHAGCHASNLGRPFAKLTTGLAAELERRGFAHAAQIEPRWPGRYQ